MLIDVGLIRTVTKVFGGVISLRQEHTHTKTRQERTLHIALAVDLCTDLTCAVHSKANVEVNKRTAVYSRKAQLALDMFGYSVKKYIATYAAAMGGVDAIVFTGGIGENDGANRAKITSNLEYMGIKIDAEANKVRGEVKDISASDAKVKTLVIPTNEELMIALDTERLLSK